MRYIRSTFACMLLAVAGLGVSAVTPGRAVAQYRHYGAHGAYHQPYYWNRGYVNPYRGYTPYYGAYNNSFNYGYNAGYNSGANAAATAYNLGYNSAYNYPSYNYSYYNWSRAYPWGAYW